MKTSDTWEVPLPKDEKLTAKELNIEDLTAKLDNQKKPLRKTKKDGKSSTFKGSNDKDKDTQQRLKVEED